MSRQPQRTSPGRKESISELVEIERAATALREKLLGEFRARRDASARHSYKEMVFSPQRCRVMWLCKASLSYRSKPEFDEDDLYATLVLREELGQHLKLFCDEFPELMKWFIENLCRMRRDIEWVEREAGKIWPLLENEYQVWAQIACDGQPAGPDWRAPGWLDKWPAELPSPNALLTAARVERLDADRTARVLKEIANRIKDQLAPVQRGALDNLRVRLAQEKETARQPVDAAPKDAGGPTATMAAANAKTKSGASIQDTGADLEIAKDSIQIIEPKARRGPTAKMEFHRAVAEVVHSFRPNWKDHLEQIAGKLDKRKLPPPAAWATRNPPARSWRRAAEYYPDVVRKALEYSLKMAAKDITEKSSQTFANPR